MGLALDIVLDKGSWVKFTWYFWVKVEGLVDFQWTFQTALTCSFQLQIVDQVLPVPNLALVWATKGKSLKDQFHFNTAGE